MKNVKQYVVQVWRKIEKFFKIFWAIYKWFSILVCAVIGLYPAIGFIQFLSKNIDNPDKYINPIASVLAICVSFSLLIINYSNVYFKDKDSKNFEKLNRLTNVLISSFMFPAFFLVFVSSLDNVKATGLLKVEMGAFFILFLISVIVLFSCLVYFFVFVLNRIFPDNKKITDEIKAK
jgi:hypothetical protein